MNGLQIRAFDIHYRSRNQRRYFFQKRILLDFHLAFRNPSQFQRTKYMAVQCHFMLDLLSTNIIYIDYINTDVQIADYELKFGI